MCAFLLVSAHLNPFARHTQDYRAEFRMAYMLFIVEPTQQRSERS